MNSLDIQVAITLLAFLMVGFVYASWFKRIRAALGFVWLLWFTLGLSTQLISEVVPSVQLPDLSGVVLVWLPWNLLILALLPYKPLRSAWVLIPVAILASQLILPLLFPDLFSGAIFNPDMWLSEQLPKTLVEWMTPFSALMMVLVALAFFARWQLTDRPNELSLSLMCTLLLAGMLRPSALALWVAAAGVVLLLAVLYSTHRMAFVDALTVLPNRRALDAAQATLPRHYAVAMLDVDHFKRINDRFGHEFGDQVLRMIAARLKRIRGFSAYRYGGEEFCLIFKGNRVDQAAEICEQVRRAVSQSPIAIRSPERPDRKPLNKGKFRQKVPSVKVTVSIGLATVLAHESPDSVIERADKALYTAKRGGRDKLVLAKSKAKAA